MSLAMARPWKHPNSGVYWLRKRVPDDLLKLVGKREEKRSLQTRDPAEAKRRHAEALVEIEAHQMVAAVHDRWLQQHQDNPSQQTSWRTDLADRLFAPPEALTMDDIRSRKLWTNVDLDAYEARKMEQWCQELADERLAAHGLVVDDGSRRKLAVAIGAAVQRASLMLARLAKGEIFSSAALFPAHSKLPAPADTRPLTFKFLVDGWATERRPVAKTVYEWSRVVRQLEKYLGHSDASPMLRRSILKRQACRGACGQRSDDEIDLSA